MNKRKSNFSTVLLLLLACFTLLNQLHLSAQITDQTISFSTPKVDLVFQPPLRTGFNSDHPMDAEVAQLNLAVNLFENYMQYLLKLQKISTGTSLHFIYAPEQSSESWNDNPNLITLNNTGLNQILSKVNSYLSQKETTDTSYLLDSAETLFNIPDQYSRKECKVASELELTNISAFIDSLEPDSEMVIGSSRHTYSTRPFKNSNRMLMFSEENNVCSASIILEQGQSWYANLRPSTDNRFMAFTEDNEPMVMSIKTKNPVKLFPEQKTLALSMEWSPKFPLISGMVLDLDSQERHLFIFDAEKNKMLEVEGISNLQSNYLYSWAHWSPDGKKIVFTSGRQLSLINTETKKAYPNITSLPNEISEFIWSTDSNSFAVVEIIGQARSKTVFDDFDLRKSILHRFKFNSDNSVTEDHAQRIESRNTIKLVSFWTLDRVLYVEGRLISKKFNTPFWDLSRTFSAHLTPPPSVSISKGDADKVKKIVPVNLPMKYLYIFRSLDGKFSNVYDAGFAHSNHIFSGDQNNIWFIGLRKPDDLKEQKITFNFRSAPYPFMEINRFVFTEFPGPKMERFVKFLEDYNLRVTRFSDDNSKVFFLANFCGLMNIFEGDFRQMVEGLSSPKGN